MLLNKKVKVNVLKAKFFKDEVHFTLRNMLLFSLLFAALGGYFIWRSFAAVPVVGSLQAESLPVLPAGVSIINDSTPEGGGRAIQFSAKATASGGSVNLTDASTQLSIWAKAIVCNSAAPQLVVTVDTTVVKTMPVSSSYWTEVALGDVTLPSGNHTISIGMNSDSYTQYAGNSGNVKCQRSLSVDRLTFYGPATVSTPAPTVKFLDSNLSVTAGGSATLNWTSTNAAACTASGSWSGAQPVSGTYSTGALSATSTYSLNCSGAGGSATVSATVTVTPPISTSTGSMYWGAYMDGEQTYDYYYGPVGTWKDAPWATNTWDKFESNTGKKVSLVHFGSGGAMWVKPFDKAPLTLTNNRGAVPYLDMDSGSALLTDIAGGTYDSSIHTWAAAAKAYGKPFFFRFDREMNGGWYSWGQQAKQNPANFIAAWRHLHDVVVSEGATNVTWVWCPNTIHTGSTDLTTLYPGDTYVDWTCIDGYNQSTSTYWISFYNLYKPTYDQLLSIAPNKPIMIGEIGSREVGGSKASWITDMLSTQLPNNFPRIKAFSWFNWRENGVEPWPIESSSTAQAAFKNGLTSSHYAPGGSYGNLPLLTKVQPLP